MPELFELPEEQLADARVIVVDDDALVTSSLRSFFTLEMDLDPVVFNEPQAALAYMRENKVDLVISDFLMPDIDGIHLLQEARRLHPEVPRVLLTGYADKQSAIRAINEVQLFQYLEKPWENERLRRIVINGVERLYLLRALIDKLNELSETQHELANFKHSLIRAFA